ncbi:MAG: gamma carbonic anhydrase family protein, partial [Comamonas sp.]|nr:gamma carbonic anhydrase family protein [Comamonas sp.]
MAVYELDGISPEIAASAWVADSAQVMGKVNIGDAASIWFGTVVRGDTSSITIGEGSNVQDASV